MLGMCSAIPNPITNAFTGDLEEREEDMATGDSSLPGGCISKGPLHFPFCRKFGTVNLFFSKSQGLSSLVSKLPTAVSPR